MIKINSQELRDAMQAAYEFDTLNLAEFFDISKFKY